MRKILFLLSIIVSLSLFVSCDYFQQTVNDYYLNEEGNLIARYFDGSEKDLGLFSEELLDSIGTVKISEDGYYVINNITTEIYAKVPKSFSLNEKGHLIVVYTDDTTEDLGDFSSEIIDSIGSVTVSEDGFFIIDDIKTDISANTPKSYSLDEESHLIVTYLDDTIEDLGDFSDLIVNSLDTITISDDGYFIVNGINTDISTKVPDAYTIDENGHLIVTYIDATTEDLGNLATELVNGVSTITISDDGYYVVNNFKTSIVAIEVYTVVFNPGFVTTILPQEIKEGHRIENPSISRTGYTLNGWFYSDEKWTFNTNTVLSDMTLTANWTANEYNVTYVNSKGTVPESDIFTYDSDISLPEPANIDGYTFNGWYNNSDLVENGKWKIAKDVTLTANWTANTYEVTLDPDVGSVTNTSHIVTYNSNYSLPVPTNSYGTFVGWLCDGIAVTDSEGKSLSSWKFTSNKIFTVEWTIQVSNVSDLLKMNDFLNGDFVLQNDIDLENVVWTPVGTAENPFVGHLDGANFKISNLTMTTALGYTGLFGYLKGHIENIILDKVALSIGTATKDSYVGALAGYATNATIDNIIINGSVVTATHSSQHIGYTAGLIGYALSSNFTNIINNAVVSGAYYVGGILGYEDLSEVHMCVNNGDITSTQSKAGGIIAYLTCKEYGDTIYSFERLRNTGNISSNNNAGGLIADVGESIISFTECSNTGDVIGNNAFGYYAGGFLGYCNKINAIDCYNKGNIDGNEAGGIVGHCQSVGKLINCYSSGNITAKNYSSGGLAGYTGTDTEISQCAVFGSTGHDNFTGGYIGIISNSYYNCTATEYVGTLTTEKYSKNLYINSMFWEEYDVLTGEGTWIFSDSAYPILVWEQNY